MSSRVARMGAAIGAITLAVGAIVLFVRPAYPDATVAAPQPRTLKQGVLRQEVDKVLDVVPPVFRVDTFSVRSDDNSIVRMDTLAITADSVSYPSLQQGGFLRLEVARYNQRARRLAMVSSRRSVAWLDSARRVSTGLLAVRGDTARRVTLAPPSALVSDAPRQPVSVTFRESRKIGILVDARGYRVAVFDSGGGGEATAVTGCRFDPAENRSLRLRCVDRQKDGGVVLQVFANDAQPAAGFAFSVERGLVALNGARVGKKGSVKPNDLLALGSRQFLYTVVHSDPIVPAQTVNGRPQVFPPADSAQRFLMPLAYARIANSGTAVATTLDPWQTRVAQSALDAAVAEGNGDAEYAVIIQTDVRTGEIRAIAQTGDLATPAGRWRFMEPMSGGSSTKPLVYAAILSQRPDLLTFRTRDDGSGLVSLLGKFVPFDAGEIRCPDGLIGLVAGIECSSNALAVAFTAKGFSVLAKGLALLFGISLMEAEVDNPRASLALWGAAEDNLVPAVLEPSSSRLMVRRAVGTRKPNANDIVSLSLGARAGRWTPLDVAQGYVRLVSGRETSVHLVGNNELGVPWPFAGAKWHEAVLEGMERVVATGTGRTLFEGGGRPRGTLVLGKTGTLNETDARARTVVIASGEPVRAGSRQLRCGTVTVIHVSHRRGVSAPLDKVADRALLRLSRNGAFDNGC